MAAGLDVAMIGRCPPPIGGISVHVQRLATRCLSDGLVCAALDPYAPRNGTEPEWLIRFNGGQLVRFLQLLVWLANHRYGVVHVHVSAMDRFLWIAWPILMLTRRARMRVITVHSGSFMQRMRKRRAAARWAASRLLRQFDRVIAVNEELGVFMETFMKVNPRRIFVVPAFIMPNHEEGIVPQCVQDLRLCSHLVVGSGYATSLYAHEVLLQAVDRLQKQGLDIGLVLALYSQYEEPYFSALRNRASRMPNVLLTQHLEPGAFNQLLAVADVYVRTARRDGDSVAVREALAQGCHVVASDCVARPAECEVYVTDNVESLCKRIKTVLHANGGLPVVGAPVDFAESIIAIYDACATH